MTHRDKKNLKDIRMYKRHFAVLKGWKIRYRPNEPMVACCTISSKTNYAEIYKWGKGTQPKDYIIHEMLHIVLAANRRVKGWLSVKQMEEETVRSICGIIADARTRK